MHESQLARFIENQKPLLFGGVLTRTHPVEHIPLSSVLEENPDPKYQLTAKACQGILRRAHARGRELPPALEIALLESIYRAGEDPFATPDILLECPACGEVFTRDKDGEAISCPACGSEEVEEIEEPETPGYTETGRGFWTPSLAAGTLRSWGGEAGPGAETLTLQPSNTPCIPPIPYISPLDPRLKESAREAVARFRGSEKPVAAPTSNGVGTCGADDNQAQVGHILAEEHSEPGGTLFTEEASKPRISPSKDSPTVYGTGRYGGPQEAAVATTKPRSDFDTESFVVEDGIPSFTHPLTARYDSSEDGGGRGTPLVPVEVFPIMDGREMATKTPNGSEWKPEGSPAFTLDTLGWQAVGYIPKPPLHLGVSPLLRVARRAWRYACSLKRTLEPEERSEPVPLLEVGARTNPDSPAKPGHGIGHPGDVMFTLQASVQHGLATDSPYSASENQRGEMLLNRCAAALSSGGGKPGQGYAAVLGSRIDTGDPFIFERRIARNGAGQPSPVVSTLKVQARSDASPMVAAPPYPRSTHNSVKKMVVRRLTVLECERLQALPDGWTQVPEPSGKEASDAARYKAIGNAVCVSNASWVMGRMKEELFTAGSIVAEECPA